MLFPENTPYRVPNNPFRGTLPKTRKKEHREALNDALMDMRATFLYSTEGPIEFDGASVGIDMSTENFNATVTTVIAAIERGYYSTRDPTPLGTSEWARLSCTILAAVGRGYHRQYSTENESTLKRVRAETIDPNPLPKNPTLFHRLAAIADDINTHVGTDQEDYQDWYVTLKDEFNTKAAKAAAVEIDEKWLIWKANQLDLLAQQNEKDIIALAKDKGIDYFIATGQRMGLQITRGPTTMSSIPTPTLGRKRTISGSLPRSGRTTPVMRKAIVSGSHTDSPTTPRGRTIPCVPVEMQVDPPIRPQETIPPETGKGNTLDLDTIMTVIKAAMGPAIQSAMAPIAAKISALEKATMTNNPPPLNKPREPPAPEGVEASIWAPANLARTTNIESNDFTPVTRNERGKRAKNKTNANRPTSMQASQETPAQTSYASVATAAIATAQPPPLKQLARVTIPTITEITVLRDGGFNDANLEDTVRARAADAIVREVTIKMAKAVARPIPLKAGRWSIHPRSKGNFVYSFDGNVPFDLITTYEHILLAPFRGSGKLSPSMGWTRLLAHGVPVWDDYEDRIFKPEDLLREVKAMPGLKRAHFAMPPRWLKPAERIESNYSTITFAISDPDGTITNKLLTGRAALFGKEVVVQRWIDKPALIQCSHCHALGHIRSSRSCTLARDSVKCYICGGAHTSDRHSQNCPKKHAVAGICDCKHYKCLNCHKPGHDCKDTRCPARDLFRPRQSRGRKKPKGKGKEKEMNLINFSVAPHHATIEECLDSDGDLYDPPPLPPNPTGPQIRSALHDMAIANLCNNYDQSMEIDGGNTGEWSYDNDKYPDAMNGGPSGTTEVTRTDVQPTNHSPSRPQTGDTHRTIA